ncbi:PorP/SprF family type IX secretion system membrane protein [Aquimarina brevivitae]|uniref:Type IX secretion system PorP/SprF family membrane protein n=1 Tax=Aquimarina brevivitae TaxID=323412 RepID=A0A4Q7NU08_9FLAO|nr:PorP/SprF family type IX secretion system membrane protein [Aquimarina brevivitae]RZS90595.1 type IX secretion system PorP/SprF family membrane protein [Aquimarina brevivitae]
MIKNIKLICIAVFLLSTVYVKAQQDPDFSLYNYNMNLLNPAYAGTEEGKGVTLAYRRQWLGLPDAPRYISASYSQGIGEKIGLGISIFNNEFAITNRTVITSDFSYKLKISGATNLFLGLKAGVNILNINYSQLQTTDPDPVSFENINEVTLVGGVGAYLVNPKYYISISTPQFLKENIENSTEPDGINFYVGAGYHFTLSDNFILSPRAFARLLEDFENTFDIGASLDMYDRFTFGVNHRFDRMVTTYGLVKIFEPMTIGLSYDFITSEFTRADTDGSLDFILKYNL